MRRGAADYLVKDRLTTDLFERTIRTVREKHILERERELMIRRLAELSVMDELTRVPNRRHLMTKVQEEILRAERTAQVFSVLMVDLDRFKEVNDRLGHQAGDDVLRRCAAAILLALRGTDFTARYGGDEFLVLLPNTALDGARLVAEKLRRVVFELHDPVSSVSIGAAGWEPGVTRDVLLRRADRALYAAKEAGRNRVAVFSRDMETPADSLSPVSSGPGESRSRGAH
jgi:diguanylate cyclase (GGDEF)-like protein